MSKIRQEAYLDAMGLWFANHFDGEETRDIVNVVADKYEPVLREVLDYIDSLQGCWPRQPGLEQRIRGLLDE